ncbi:hypothetical protein CCACVL1_21463 [Corchorus capsularis]|uniref:FBD domain-containing protein n=1 Tax=Corchorus capsularis TaxID=210143 RepID=A0A1R3H5J8_COCAP|nr:hypothetical protein CCACVL1_21463 [Corchorus capsularis]
MGEIVETSSKRQRVCEEEAVDRIRSLPDSVLIHILSCLPTKDAIRTVLVPRFRHLCNFLTTLTFNHSWYGTGEEGCKDFLDYVRRVLLDHQNGTIDKFALKVDVNFLYSKKVENANDDIDDGYIVDYEDLYLAGFEERKASEVDSWIHFAMRKNVKVLDLDFLVYGEPKPDASYRLPSVVFREKQLKTVKIYGGYITEPYVIDTVEFLLKNATVLEKLEISTKKTLKHSHQAYSSRQKVELTTEQRVEFSQQLLSLPRASPRAVIHIS